MDLCLSGSFSRPHGLLTSKPFVSNSQSRCSNTCKRANITIESFPTEKNYFLPAVLPCFEAEKNQDSTSRHELKAREKVHIKRVYS